MPRRQVAVSLHVCAGCFLTCRDAAHFRKPPACRNATGCGSLQLTTPLVSVTCTSLKVTVPVFSTTIVFSTVSPTSGKPLASLSTQRRVPTENKSNNDTNSVGRAKDTKAETAIQMQTRGITVSQRRHGSPASPPRTRQDTHRSLCPQEYVAEWPHRRCPRSTSHSATQLTRSPHN